MEFCLLFISWPSFLAFTGEAILADLALFGGGWLWVIRLELSVFVGPRERRKMKTKDQYILTI